MKILLIAGCNVELTPVIKSYINYLHSTNHEIDIVEFVARNRLKFIWCAIRGLFKQSYSKFVFVNFQSLPVLFFASFFGFKKLVYWKLESYQPFDNRSFVLKLQLIEWILNRKLISLVLPTNQRVEIQKPIFKKTYVLPNAPYKPYKNLITNKIISNKPISFSLVMYGNSSFPDDIYLSNWISLVQFSSKINFSVIGPLGISHNNIKFFGRLSHADLISVLLTDSFHYSIVGYKNKNLNTFLAAPNKLIESLSCGIPIIGNINNPYVAEIVNFYKCGILLDFDCLNLNILLDLVNDYPQHSINALLAANELCLFNQINKTPLGIN